LFQPQKIHFKVWGKKANKLENVILLKRGRVFRGVLAMGLVCLGLSKNRGADQRSQIP
jgi:hypothetical protein